MSTQLIDIVFPGSTNHHGTLFGGLGLAHMDKVAFVVAARHAHVDFVTASCERIDFHAPANLGEIIELTGSITRLGTRSLAATVDLVAESPRTGERRLCGRGVFNMVAVGTPVDWRLPPAPPTPPPPAGLRMVELVFPVQTSHYGSLYGGNALVAMGKAAFVAATRRTRRSMVMAAVERVDLTEQIHQGELIEVSARVSRVGTTSVTVEVALVAESLDLGTRRNCGDGAFVMVAVDEGNRPVQITPEALAT